MGELNPRLKRRLKQIKEKIPIDDVLTHYGYPIHGGSNREEQFPCDLHGDGHDGKPSARIYPDSNSWYCFACGLIRDAVETVKAKEKVTFVEAISILEKRYHLPNVSWEDGDDVPQKITTPKQFLLPKTDKTFEDNYKIFESILMAETQDRSLPLSTITKFWEASDKLNYLINKKQLSDSKGSSTILLILEKLHIEIKKASNVEAHN